MARFEVRRSTVRARGARGAEVWTVTKRLAPLMVLATAACATLFNTAATEVVESLGGDGADSDVFGETATDRSASSGADVTSVYVVGPVPGWESSPRPTPSASHSAYFEADVFGGACPGLNIDPAATDDAFGSRSSFQLDLFDYRPLQAVDPHYARFGRVWLGRETMPETSWQASGLWGTKGGTCGFFGIPLLTFGASYGGGTLLR